MDNTPGPPEPILSPPPAETPPESVPVPLEFSGQAGEYFRIWIVNICLSVLTLGIYSAWAKVRTQRYFYAHTRIAGTPLDYLANPLGILKGRLLVVAVLGLYTGITYVRPELESALGIAFLFILPWLVVKSLTFRARNSSWRNIRLGFDGTYGDALKVFVGLPILIPFTLGLIYPYFQWHRARFVYSHSRFGTTPFAMGATAGEFFSIFTRAAGLMLIAIAVLTFAGTMLLPWLTGTVFPQLSPDDPVVPVLVLIGTVLPILAIWICIMPAYAYVQAHIANTVWNSIRIGSHGFSSDLKTRPLAWIYFSNLVATVLTLGLAIPWAKVRMARYRVERMTLLKQGDLDRFVQGEAQQVSASGEEFGDMMDIDVGL